MIKYKLFKPVLENIKGKIINLEKKVVNNNNMHYFKILLN